MLIKLHWIEGVKDLDEDIDLAVLMSIECQICRCCLDQQPNTLGNSALFRVLAPPCLMQQWLRSALSALQGTSALRNCTALRFCVLRDKQRKSSTRRRPMEGWNNKKIDVTPRTKFRSSQKVLGWVTLGWLPMLLPRPETKRSELLLWTCVAESSWSQIEYVP